MKKPKKMPSGPIRVDSIPFLPAAADTLASRSFTRRVVVGGLAYAGGMAAFAAWHLRDNPEQLEALGSAALMAGASLVVAYAGRRAVEAFSGGRRGEQ